MIIDSTSYAVQYGYQANTQLAITWDQLEGGLWRGRDRGTSNDKIFSECVFVGTEDEISDLEQVFRNARNSSGASAYVTMTPESKAERIFGADISNATYSVLLVNKSTISRTSKSLWQMPVTLMMVNTPTSDGGTWTWNKRWPLNYSADRDYNDRTQINYNTNALTSPRDYTSKVHSVVLKLTQNEMRDFRYTMVNVVRANQFNISAANFNWFGANESYTYARMVSWDGGVRDEFGFWSVNCSFVAGDS